MSSNAEPLFFAGAHVGAATAELAVEVAGGGAAGGAAAGAPPHPMMLTVMPTASIVFVVIGKALPRRSPE